MSPSISADGRSVAFSSDATNLVAGDTNDTRDVFVRGRFSGTTERVSVSSLGGETDKSSIDPVISACGRYVVFYSNATNLVPGDTNAVEDVFLHDRLTGETTRVSVDSTGLEGNDYSGGISAINADGRFIAFNSGATNLVPGDTNGVDDVFVHERISGKTVRVSVGAGGGEGDGSSNTPSISADGRYVAFLSYASNLVAGDTNGYNDIFVHDRNTGTTTRVSVDSAGLEADFWSEWPSISADGNTVAFHSYATNLVANDTNGTYDIFVHDMKTGATTRVSTDSAGVEGNNASLSPSVNAGGRFIVFYSFASNFVAADTDTINDVYIHDRDTGQTSLVSVSTSGVKGNADSQFATVSADGRFVAFVSYASNLVKGDTNGSGDVFVYDRLLNRFLFADLELVVTSQPASVQKGTTGTYTYTVTNRGPDSANSVTLIDISSRPAMSAIPSQGNCIKGVLSICRFHTLASGASATVDFTLKATSLQPLNQRVTVYAIPTDPVPVDNVAAISTTTTP